MARNKKLQIRLSDNEYKILDNYSKSTGIGMSEIVRDYIKSLTTQPTPPSLESSYAPTLHFVVAS